MQRPSLLSIASFLIVVSTATFAQVPDPVSELSWCPGAKDCLVWSTVTGVSEYRLYRGARADLPGLLGAAPSGCLLGSFATPSTGTLAEPAPDAGRLHWYLVTGQNDAGEGSAGEATAGPRQLTAASVCAADPRLVLNEIDYDQPGIDFGEFVEIVNIGDAPVDLTDVALIFINGSSTSEYARVELITAAPSLEGGLRLVVGTESILASLPAGVPSAALPATSNNVQNGAPDGVALVDLAAGRLLDSLSYEGPLTGVTLDGFDAAFDLATTKAVDSSTAPGSLARVPDGTVGGGDDWQFVTLPSPGAPNPKP